jgi:5-methylcytosine-specific restriction endonuclease McrA
MKHNEKLLDDLWSKAIKIRDHYKCQYCHAVGTEAHHLISRRHKIARWNLLNGVCLCAFCHRLAHDKKLFIKVPDEISLYKYQVAKFSNAELETIKKGLRDYIKGER